MAYFAQERINVTKEISMMKLDLSNDFTLTLGTSSKGVKFDKPKFEKFTSALANACLEIPMLGKLGWKFLNGEVQILSRQIEESQRIRESPSETKSSDENAEQARARKASQLN